MVNETQRELLVKRLANRDEMMKAVINAVQEAVCQHKAMGNSIALWKDDHVVIVPAQDIVVSHGVQSETVCSDEPLLIS